MDARPSVRSNALWQGSCSTDWPNGAQPWSNLGNLAHLGAISADLAQLWSNLADLRIPVLIIHGTADKMVPIANSARLVAAMPSARLVRIEGAFYTTIELLRLDSTTHAMRTTHHLCRRGALPA